MKICGLQKTTFIDYPGKVACTIFLHGCNFKCGFCHNPELVVSAPVNEISQEDFFKFLEKRRGELEGVCITGGEPLMTLDEDFLSRIKQLGYSIKLDTNGSFPEKLKSIIKKGLVDFIAMDLKNSKESYLETINSIVPLEKIEESIRIIFDFGNYEFRTTIVNTLHSKEDIVSMAKWVNSVAGGKPAKFVLQGFKNQGKLIDGKFKEELNTSERYLQELKLLLDDYFESIEIRV